jgi:hypothetical protein
VCNNAVQISASKEKMKAVFTKIGVVTFTRECLNDKHVRHDICLVNGEAVDVLDPMPTYYIRLEAENKAAVVFLHSLGCKGDLLKSELPHKYVVDCSVDADVDERVSVPLAEQTILALMRANTIGDSYNALTDGKAGHLTSDKHIIDAERIVLAKDIKEVEDEKVLRLQSTDRSDAAVAVLAKQKGGTALKVTELDTLLKWKLGKPFHKPGMLKATKLKKRLDVKNLPEATVLSAWSTADEEALEADL